MRLLAAVVVLAVPFAAHAQVTVTLELNGSNDTTMVNSVGPNDCGSDLTVTWGATLPTGNEACGPLDIWVTPDNCEQFPDGGAGEFIVASIDDNTNDPSNWMAQGATGTAMVSLPVSSLPTGAGASVCGAQVDIIYNLCAAFSYASTATGCVNTSTTNILYAVASPNNPNITIEYDSAPPDPPQFGLSPGDTTVTATANAYASDGGFDLNVSTMNIYYLQATDGGAPAATSPPFNGWSQTVAGYTGNVTVTGLTDGTPYWFFMTATSPGGTSAPTAIQTATPVLTQGFFGYYIDSGGTDRGGGCAAVPFAFPTLALAGLGLLRARRRR